MCCTPQAANGTHQTDGTWAARTVLPLTGGAAGRLSRNFWEWWRSRAGHGAGAGAGARAVGARLGGLLRAWERAVAGNGDFRAGFRRGARVS